MGKTTEQTQAGYAPSTWSCSGGTLSGANVTLGAGGVATCTISNNDIGPTLTLVKTITNNAGGTKTLSDFPLTATGPQTISGTSGTTAVTDRTVNAGTYALTEQTQANYAASTWSCSGGSQSGTNVTLGLGQSATCTITNDDIYVGRGAIAPTQTTCEDFVANNFTPLPDLFAQIRGNKINSVAPGVFFYYPTVTKGVGTAAGFIQTKTPNTFTLYGVQNDQAYLYTVVDGSCTRVATLTSDGNGQYSGGASLPAGDYILGVKFETAAAKGFAASLLPATNTFQLIGGGSLASINTTAKWRR